MIKAKATSLKILSLLILTLALVFSLAGCNTENNFVAGYLDDLSVPEFHKEKLRGVEVVYRDYYVKDIPSPDVLSQELVNFYFENFHNEIDNSDPDAVTDALIYSYISVIGDKYSYYRNEQEHKQYKDDMSGSFSGIGVSVTYDYAAQTMTVTEVHPESGAADAGIKIGDKIIKVNGTPISEMEYQEAVYTIRGEAGTTVDITLDRGGKEITVTATRKKVVEQSVLYSIDQNRIGYIKISAFNSNTPGQFDTAISYMLENGAVGIVYDLRSNPGGYLDAVVKMLSRIAPKGTTLVSFSNNYSSDYKDKTEASLSLPSVVICNGATASAGELFTAAMRDFDTLGYFDVTIVGEKTYGKGVMQNTYTFTDNSSITLTVAYYNSPSGENYDGIGISPDVEISNNDSQNDAQLNTAYIEINKLINN